MSDIRHRLKLAFENVAFYADRTWANEPVAFQRANQEVFARGAHLDELLLEEATRPRTVQDSIPRSKLAQYDNYEYNESRELSYAAHGVEVSIFYPCLHYKGKALEPWMLPEVEQLFIWLAYAPQFELFTPQFLGDLEEIENAVEHRCGGKDLHWINPKVYDAFERTPGKSRYKQTRRFTVDEDRVCTIIRMDDFDEMKLRMYLRQDKIKEIWERNTSPSRRKKYEIFCTPLKKFFVDELSKPSKNEYANIQNMPHYFNDLQEKSHDFRNMQTLAESLNLEIKIPVETEEVATTIVNVEVKKHVNREIEEPKQETAAPVRRLYSDVVQGLSPNKGSSTKTRQSEATSPSSTITSNKDTPIASPKTTTTSCTEESTASSPQKNMSAPWQWGNSNNAGSSQNQQSPNENLPVNRFNVSETYSVIQHHQGHGNFVSSQANSSMLQHRSPVNTTTQGPSSSSLQTSVLQASALQNNVLQQGSSFLQGNVLQGSVLQGNVMHGNVLMHSNALHGNSSAVITSSSNSCPGNSATQYSASASSSSTFHPIHGPNNFATEHFQHSVLQVSSSQQNNPIQGVAVNPRLTTMLHIDTESSQLPPTPNANDNKKGRGSESFKLHEKCRTFATKPKTPPHSTSLKVTNYNAVSYTDNVTGGTNSFCPFSSYATPWNFWGGNESEQLYNYQGTLLNAYSANFYTGSPYQYTQAGLLSNSFATLSYNGTGFASSFQAQSSGRGRGFQNNPNQAWLLQQYRPPICNVGHFTQPYFIVSQPVGKNSQRWNQQCVRPNTPSQNCHSAVQNQFNPNLYRSNSNLQIFDANSERMKKGRKPSAKITPFKEQPTPKPDPPRMKPCTSKKPPEPPQQEVKYIYKKDTRTEPVGLITVTETASEELERLAIAEYQSSSENFYKDLEKQAEEQYEEGPGNCVGPPSEGGLGGLQLARRLALDLVLLLALCLNLRSCLVDCLLAALS